MNASIAIAGYGKSGRALAREALEWCKQGRAESVVVFDDQVPEFLESGLSYGGSIAKLKKENPAQIWMSPGISPRQVGVPTSELKGELDIAQEKTGKNQKIIAVTGTNGKTTTVELIQHLLSHAGIRSASLGNIGTPWLDGLDPAIEVYLLEVSSFQLELVQTFHPNISVITNIAEDHLDWHGGMRSYAKAKWKITKNQTKEDALILGSKLEPPKGVELKAKTLQVGSSNSCAKIEGEFLKISGLKNELISISNWKLPGFHNQINLTIAALVALEMGLTAKSIEEGLSTFKAPAHRQESLGTVAGIQFINDSKGTNPHSVAAALRNFERVILIFGGFDKGLDCAEFLRNELPFLSGLVLLGPLGARLVDEIPFEPKVRFGKTLEEAFAQAVRMAKAGDTVLLSPGSSSFDEFQDYTKRGEAFSAHLRRFAHVHDAAPQSV